MKKEKDIRRNMLNPFAIFALVIGLIMGLNKGYPNEGLMYFGSFFAASLYYIVALAILNAFD